eukprot:6188414-Pleurochrysis_carterae.AAC.1
MESLQASSAGHKHLSVSAVRQATSICLSLRFVKQLGARVRTSHKLPISIEVPRQSSFRRSGWINHSRDRPPRYKIYYLQPHISSSVRSCLRGQYIECPQLLHALLIDRVGANLITTTTHSILAPIAISCRRFAW